MPVIVQNSGLTSLDLLVRDVAPHVPECPQPLIREKLLRACRDFFSASYCWRERRITLLTTVQGQQAYAYAIPANAELLQVMSAWDGDTEVDADLPGDDDEYSPDFEQKDVVVGVSDDGSELELRPLPNTTGTVIKGSVSYTLAENASAIPSWVYREYREGLAAGAASLLVIQPQKPWSNPGAFPGLRALFSDAVSDATNKAGPVRRKAIRSKPW